MADEQPIPEFIFNQTAGPRLVFLSDDGQTSASVFIDNNGILRTAEGTDVIVGKAVGMSSTSMESSGRGPGDLILMEHWISSTAAGNCGWTSTNSGTSAATSILSSIAGRPGIAVISTGTTATGRSSLNLGTTSIALGEGRYIFNACIRIPDISNVSNRYVLRIGFGDNTSSGDMVDGAYFEYDESNSSYWRIKTSASSIRSTQTTSVYVDQGQFIDLKIEVHNNMWVKFYINGSMVGTPINTNIPVPSSNQQTGVIFKIEKTTGTTARTAQIDWAQLYFQP